MYQQGFEVGLCISISIFDEAKSETQWQASMPSIATVINGVFPASESTSSGKREERKGMLRKRRESQSPLYLNPKTKHRWHLN
jgi:hypothetical protein